jgi:2-polyprenyl-3-methyl-5-hydroxy-6-metoxy-1,4-benzoquinol methylase
VACGFGGSALFLASVGFQVDAVDTSGVALTQAQAEAARRSLEINLVQADWTRWWVAPACYDLIVVFLYLNRRLMPKVADGLRPGGLLFQANRNTRLLAIRPGFNPRVLVKPGELRQLAYSAGLEVLYHADGTPDDAHVSQLIARRPAA